MRRRGGRSTVDLIAAATALAAWLVLPWNFVGAERSALSFALEGRWPLYLPLAASLAAGVLSLVPYAAAVRLLCAAFGFLTILAYGFWPGLIDGTRPLAHGAGALIVALALLVQFSRALARLGAFKADSWVATATVGIAVAVIAFVLFPVGRVLTGAVEDRHGAVDLALFWSRFASGDVWSLACLYSDNGCGVVVNTILLGVLAGGLSTLLGLAFALIAQRTGLGRLKAFDAISILPIITPPFVIALALVVLFGRTGIVTTFLENTFDIPRSRWIYGLPGILIAQLLSQTPLAYLILKGALQGISPSLEEASATLRASRWQTFRTITWPLLRPALAASLLLGFVESLADFGNPLVLGASYDVLSTKIFFAVVGAQHDPGRAAVLAIILLVLTLAAFYLQLRWLGRSSYVTVTGKGDSGLAAPLPRRVTSLSLATVLPWALLTLCVYGIILVGGFVQDIGRGAMAPTFEHFHTGFSVEWQRGGLYFAGSAWNSFFVTVTVAAIAAPLTTAIGILTAYILARHDFVGRRSFEFMTMLAFAIPGTVIGLAYILAFNVPPLELTGTGAILIICFIFRNMPVGVRAGAAALAQIDRSLDEASTTLGARTGTTVRRVILPLLKPALVATLVFSFVHAMTAVSAVIFLATARYNLATVYIANRVEAGEYALGIAYASLLIMFMLVVVIGIQLAVGERRLGRRSVAAAPTGLGAH